VDGADYCLIGIVLGVRTTQNIPQYRYYWVALGTGHIAQYPITKYQYRSNPKLELSPTGHITQLSYDTAGVVPFRLIPLRLNPFTRDNRG